MVVTKETQGRIYYEDELFKCLDDIRKKRNAQDLQGYSEATLTLYDFLIPELRDAVKPKYEEIQKKTVDTLAEARDTLGQIQNPLDKAGYYSGVKAGLERESADALFQELIAVLDKKGFLLKRREIEVRHITKKD